MYKKDCSNHHLLTPFALISFSAPCQYLLVLSLIKDTVLVLSYEVLANTALLLRL